LDPAVSVHLKRLGSGGKLPAEAVSALYGEGHVHHIGVFPALEDQMVSFTAQPKRDAQGPPARVPALVWALNELVIGNRPQRAKGVWLPGRRP
jgi:phage terminase large subunit-like protein